MARGKKTDKKNTAPATETMEQTEDTAPAMETMEQAEGTAPAMETPEQAEDTAPAMETPKQDEDTAPAMETPKQDEGTAPAMETMEQAEGTAPAPETPEQTEDTATTLETPEQDQATAFVKTSPEDAAKIAAQVEVGAVARLEINENGEITLKEPERDVLAGIQNPCVYCGPTVRGVARQYTTYQGGITDTLRDFITEHPEARKLIVSTAQFPAYRRRLDTPGTAEAKLYKWVKEQL